jgi:hypothetical protein
MSGSCLPANMVEVILGNLSLLELARVSSTCRAFHALYRKQLAAIREACTALSNKSFSQKQILRLGDVITRFLKAEAWGLDFIDHDTNFYQISAEGVISHVLQSPQMTAEARDAFVSPSINQPLYFACFGPDTLSVRGRNASRLLMRIHRTQRGHAINIFPKNDEDLEGVALAQALLGGGLAKYIRESRQGANLSMHSGWGGATRAGLKRQIATLVLFSSRYPRLTPFASRYPTSYRFTESMQIGEIRRPVKIMQTGQVGLFADKGTAQGLANRVIRGYATAAVEPVRWEMWML